MSSTHLHQDEYLHQVNWFMIEKRRPRVGVIVAQSYYLITARARPQPRGQIFTSVKAASTSINVSPCTRPL